MGVIEYTAKMAKNEEKSRPSMIYQRAYFVPQMFHDLYTDLIKKLYKKFVDTVLSQSYNRTTISIQNRVGRVSKKRAKNKSENKKITSFTPVDFFITHFFPK